MASLKYKEVYAAAAEVLGLTLRYIAEKENVSVLHHDFLSFYINDTFYINLR